MLEICHPKNISLEVESDWTRREEIREDHQVIKWNLKSYFLTETSTYTYTHTHTPNSRLNFFWVLFTHGFWNFSPIRICILCSFRVSFSYFVTLASSQKNQFCCFFLLLEVARNQIWKECFIQMNTCKPSRSLLRYINMLMSKLYLFTFPSCSALALFGSVLDILFFIKVFVKNYKTLSVQFTVFPPLFFQYFYSLI